MPVLELITTGRKSGVSRSVLLTYLTQDASYVVIATNAGDPRLPAWWLNLQADPAAEVVAGRKQHRVLAREAEGDERAALWERAVEMSSGYATYAEGLERRIPVVVLDPAG
jgi:deazaflavin-dependent oxidoreductase (nitroreductase family)